MLIFPGLYACSMVESMVLASGTANTYKSLPSTQKRRDAFPDTFDSLHLLTGLTIPSSCKLVRTIFPSLPLYPLLAIIFPSSTPSFPLFEIHIPAHLLRSLYTPTTGVDHNGITNRRIHLRSLHHSRCASRRRQRRTRPRLFPKVRNS